MKIGIVTVLYKSSGVIDAFIESLNAQVFFDFTVLFVENDTHDLRCEQIIRSKARFAYHFVRNRDNVGVAKGNNQGIDYFLERPEFTHIHFLNNDIEVAPSFLSGFAMLYQKHPEVQAVAPKMYYYGEDDRIWYAGGELSYWKGGCRHFGHNKKDRLSGRNLFPVTYAPTCSLMLPCSILRASHIRMREELFVYYDDMFFCWEMVRAGISIHYAPNIRLEHKISTSTGGAKSNFSRYYLTRNWAYVAHLTHNQWIKCLLPLLWLWHLARRNEIELKALNDVRKMP